MLHRVSRSAAALAAWTALCAPGAAHAKHHAAPEPLPSGRIQQLIADQERLLAIRDGEVLIFAADGGRLGGCGARAAPAPRRAHAWANAPDASELLRDAALPDDDTTLAAEELLEEEADRAPAPGARRWSAGPPLVPRALAASGTSAWVATSDGVYRVGAPGCTRAALAGRQVSAIAAGGGKLAVISGDELFEADLAGGGPAADRSFRAAAMLPTHPRLLALDAQGTVLIADDAGVLSMDAGGEVRRVLAVRADALTTCAQTVAALAADGVYLWQGQRFRRAGGRPPARVLACGDAPRRRWLAGGLGLWSSPDAASWTEQAGWLGTTVAGVAAVAGRVWLATEAGLTPVRMDDQPASGSGAAGIGSPPTPPRKRPGVPSLWCWPTITAALTVDWTSRSAGAFTRRTTTVFVLLRFPLDRPSTTGGELTALALERTRRDAELARLELAAEAAARGAADSSEADELTAWRELAADEREALR